MDVSLLIDALRESWRSVFPGTLERALASALLVFVFAGTTSKNAHRVLAPIAVGCALFALLLMTSPFSLGSLNPARSTATALFGGQVALSQLWLFWVAPIAGAVLGGLASRYVQNGD